MSTTPEATEPAPGSFFAKDDGTVWRQGERTRNPDGSTTFSLTFPVCTMHEAAGKEAGPTIARLANIGLEADGESLSVRYEVLKKENKRLQAEAATARRERADLLKAGRALAEAASSAPSKAAIPLDHPLWEALNVWDGVADPTPAATPRSMEP